MISKTAVLIVLFLVVGLPIAATQNTSQGTVKNADSGLITPDSTLYSLELAFDSFAISLGLADKEDVIRERAAEAKEMTQKENSKASERALKNMAKIAESMEESSVAIPEDEELESEEKDSTGSGKSVEEDGNKTREGNISQQRNFSARMPYQVGDKRNFELDRGHAMTFDGESLTVRNDTYETGTTFELEGVKFYYLNNTDNYANLEVTVYTDEDIVKVKESDSRVESQQFRIPVLLTNERAGTFQQITKNYGSRSGSLVNLDDTLAGMKFYINGRLETSFRRVSSGFKRGEIPTESFITGKGETDKEARKNMADLISILKKEKEE